MKQKNETKTIWCYSYGHFARICNQLRNGNFKRIQADFLCNTFQRDNLTIKVEKP